MFFSVVSQPHLTLIGYWYFSYAQHNKAKTVLNRIFH